MIVSVTPPTGFFRILHRASKLNSTRLHCSVVSSFSTSTLTSSFSTTLPHTPAGYRQFREIPSSPFYSLGKVPPPREEVLFASDNPLSKPGNNQDSASLTEPKSVTNPRHSPPSQTRTLPTPRSLLRALCENGKELINKVRAQLIFLLFFLIFPSKKYFVKNICYFFVELQIRIFLFEKRRCWGKTQLHRCSSFLPSTLEPVGQPKWLLFQNFGQSLAPSLFIWAKVNKNRM